MKSLIQNQMKIAKMKTEDNSMLDGLPFAFSSVLLELVLALGADPLLLEDLDFFAEMPVDGTEEVLSQDTLC